MNTLLGQGERAPDFILPDPMGVPFLLHENLDRGPVLLVFVDGNDEATEHALAAVDRLIDMYGLRMLSDSLVDESMAVLAVRREGEAEETLWDHAFPYAHDGKSTGVFESYALRVVPSVVLVETDGRVAFESEGFVRADFEALGRQWAETVGVLPQALFTAEDAVPDNVEGVPAPTATDR